MQKQKRLTEYVDIAAVNEVLGSLLAEPGLLRECNLNNEDFPELFHRIVFAAINNLVRSGVDELDAVTIDEYLSHYEIQYKNFRKNNGFHYIEMVKQAAKPANFSYNYDQVRKFSLLRRYVQSGIDVSEYFDPNESNPEEDEVRRRKLDQDSITDIINHFKLKQIQVTTPFVRSESRDSRKAGELGLDQLERWKNSTAWGIGYSSAYLTTILHGMRPRTLTIRSAGTGVGKTRMALADLAHACSPYYWDPRSEQWAKNPNGVQNGALYIGTEMELLTEINPILWAYIADVPEDHIKYNQFDKGEEERVRQAIEMLEKDANIWLEYLPDFTVGALSDIIEEHVLNHNVDHVFFDYIHATPELLAEFGAQSYARMTTREDQALLSLSTKLKQMTRDFGVSINTATQVNAEFRNENIRDQTLVAGAKAVINKADNAMIVSNPTLKEMKKIDSILRNSISAVPNLVLSVYKVRDGQHSNVKIWLNVDYATMRVHDLFVTDYDYKLIDIEKTYINVWSDDVATTTPIYLQSELPDDAARTARF